VTLANAKKVPVVLRVVQGFYGNYVIMQESQKSKRLNANEAQWLVTIPAGGDVKLTYSVKIGG
jgi:hypothetical protein